MGPSFRVILFVSSRDTGFSMNHASCMYSLFLIKLYFDWLSDPFKLSISNGITYAVAALAASLPPLPALSAGPYFFLLLAMLGNSCVRSSILYLKLDESTESSIICSLFVIF